MLSRLTTHLDGVRKIIAFNLFSHFLRERGGERGRGAGGGTFPRLWQKWLRTPNRGGCHHDLRRKLDTSGLVVSSQRGVTAVSKVAGFDIHHSRSQYHSNLEAAVGSREQPSFVCGLREALEPVADLPFLGWIGHKQVGMVAGSVG